MAKDKITDYSATAANNADVGGINIDEGCPAPNLNNMGREIMSHLAETNAGTYPVADTWTFGDPADLTKRFRFDGGAITAGQTRVVTIPDQDVDLTPASQAEQEAGSSTSKFVTPGRQQFHPSAAKGWCKANTVGTILASYNVTSITDNATGDLTVTWNVDFSSGQYCALASCEISGSGYLANITDATAAGSTRMRVWNPGVGTVDPSNYFMVVYGDQ